MDTVVPSSCCCRAQRKVETAEVASTPRADAISCLCSIPLRPCHYWTRQRAVTSEAQLRGALEGARKERDTALLAADGAQTAAKTSSREVSELHALLENEVGAHLCAVLNGWDAHVPSCSIVFHRCIPRTDAKYHTLTSPLLSSESSEVGHKPFMFGM